MKIDVFADEIMKQLKEYSGEVDETMKEELDAVADEALEAVSSAARQKIKGTGKYRRGFRKKLVADGMGYHRVRLSNKVYQLTHLLEYGHGKKGAPTPLVAQPRPHWEQGQKIADTLPERVEKRLKK